MADVSISSCSSSIATKPELLRCVCVLVAVSAEPCANVASEPDRFVAELAKLLCDELASA